MKSIKLILLSTTSLAVLAALAIALTIQQQNVAAFNDRNQFNFNSHNHLSCGARDCESNSASTFNTEDMHQNTNYNSHRDEPQKDNTHSKPDNGK
jgi:hypothetical protein